MIQNVILAEAHLPFIKADNKAFKGQSEEKEFTVVTLTINGCIQQAWEMTKACQAYCNLKKNAIYVQEY